MARNESLQCRECGRSLIGQLKGAIYCWKCDSCQRQKHISNGGSMCVRCAGIFYESGNVCSPCINNNLPTERANTAAEVRRITERYGGGSNDSSSGGCFITTATCSTLGKPDDCYELTTFRNFRDEWVKKNNPDLIEQYYLIAPSIVASINTKSNASLIYNEIWLNYLEPCLKLIENKSNLEAMNLYQDLVLYLKNKIEGNIN